MNRSDFIHFNCQVLNSRAPDALADKDNKIGQAYKKDRFSGYIWVIAFDAHLYCRVREEYLSGESGFASILFLSAVFSSS